MKLHIQNISTSVSDYTEQQRNFLEKILTVSTPNHQYMTAYKQGHWDGTKKFFSTQTQSFPTGFIPFIIKHFNKKKWPLTFKDYRMNHYCGATTDYDEDLRDYQIDAVDSILLGELNIGGELLPWSRGIIKISTGGGKTPLAARLMQALNVPTLYLVDSLENMYQTQKVITDWTGLPCGIMGDGNFQPGHFTVCSLRTLISRRTTLKKYFQSIQCLIVDECHRLGSNDYHKIMMSCPNSWARIGISATPLSRKDLGDAILIGDTSEIAYEVERKVLEDAGYLSKCRVLLLSINTPVYHEAKYPVAYDQLIVNNVYRNNKIVWATQKLLKKKRVILILTKIITHGNILQQMLEDKGILSYFVSGKDSTSVRASMLKGVGQDFKVLIGSTIFNQSIDCPILDDLIIASGGDSIINTIQRVGRVLRPKTHGENYAMVIDFVDRGNKHLLSHSEHRHSTYINEGFQVKVI